MSLSVFTLGALFGWMMPIFHSVEACDAGLHWDRSHCKEPVRVAGLDTAHRMDGLREKTA